VESFTEELRFEGDRLLLGKRPSIGLSALSNSQPLAGRQLDRAGDREGARVEALNNLEGHASSTLAACKSTAI